MLQRAGRWLDGWLKGVGILVACPCNIPQNPDYPLQLLKIAINHQLSSFFILVGKLWLDSKINHHVTVSQKNANLSQY